MKCAAVILFFVVCISDVTAQVAQQIRPFPLQITHRKTTNLVFPSAIKSVDRGSQDLLAQKAAGLENILQVKAAGTGGEVTNLTVITADGKLYCFDVSYNPDPAQLYFSFKEEDVSDKIPSARFSGFDAYESECIAKNITNAKPSIRHVSTRSSGLRIRLEGVYIHKKIMYYRVRIDNKTNNDFDIGQLRLMLRDKARAKRTASQENEVPLLSVSQKNASIPGYGSLVEVIAAERQPVPSGKVLVLQVIETGSGRNLELKIKSRHQRHIVSL